MNTAKKLGMMFTVIAIGVFVTACTTVGSTVVAESRNKYTVVATGKNATIALHRAIYDAEKVCSVQRKKTVMIVSKTIKYEGVRRDLSTTNKKIADIAAATGDALNFPRLDKEDDYESTVVFECGGSTMRCNYCFPVAKTRSNL